MLVYIRAQIFEMKGVYIHKSDAHQKWFENQRKFGQKTLEELTKVVNQRYASA